MFSRANLTLLAIGIALLTHTGGQAVAQGTIQSGRQRPFVTGLIPVVGPGAVGGVKVDARGIVRLVTSDDAQNLKDAREQALQPVTGDLGRKSQLRKVSLRGLNEALRQLKQSGKPVTTAMRTLAGLQRIQYVFVYPARKDIVLAGPADGWKVDDQGRIVGASTGRPPLQLDDLITALRNARDTKVAAMSCSIDPTPQGVAKLNGLLRRRGLQINQRALTEMERAMGPQQVTFEGISPTSNIAHVLLAADIRMKRIAMDLEASPIEGLPSYLKMLRDASGKPPRSAMPRWWLSPKYEPLRKGANGLAWEIRGRGVEALTEPNAHILAKKWAALMTRHYVELCDHLPVFAQLQSCIDLSVVGALISDYQLLKVGEAKLDLLMDDKLLQTTKLPAPATLAPHATALRKGRSWIISVSGGVKVNPWKTLNDPTDWQDTKVYQAAARHQPEGNWWWD